MENPVVGGLGKIAGGIRDKGYKVLGGKVTKSIPDGKVGFYQEPNLQGNVEIGDTYPECRGFERIPVARSVENNTGHTIVVYEQHGCSGTGTEIPPDTICDLTSPARFFKSK